MRSHLTRRVLLPICLGVVAVTLAGCASSASPMASTEQTSRAASAADAGPFLPFDESTTQGALLLAASEELDESILPGGFHYVETVDIDHSGSTSSVYVQGQPEDQGPGLYVYVVRAGVEVEYLGDSWTPEPLPELSSEMPVVVVSDPEGQERAVVSVDASPIGTVRLIGDGVARAELVEMAGRLLDSVG